MLTLEQIRASFAEGVFQRSSKSALVEYLQYEILDSLYKQKMSEKLTFIGGTAIHIIYKSQRFSEDLDFDNFGLTFEAFKTLLEAVSQDMRQKGFDIEFRFVEKLAFHCYIKFPKLLFGSNLSTHQDEKILIRIDTVEKVMHVPPETTILNGFGVYRKILVHNPSVLLTQKIIAILERKNAKGRDFYDVSYLLGFSKIDYEYLEKSRGIKKENFKATLIARMDTLDLERLASEVTPFLFNPEDSERVSTFREYIVKAI